MEYHNAFEPNEEHVAGFVAPGDGQPIYRFWQVIGIWRIVMKNIRHQLSMSNPITTQFVSYNFPEFTSMTAQ